MWNCTAAARLRDCDAQKVTTEKEANKERRETKINNEGKERGRAETKK
jgi:hypothetical protein